MRQEDLKFKASLCNTVNPKEKAKGEWENTTQGQSACLSQEGVQLRTEGLPKPGGRDKDLEVAVHQDRRLQAPEVSEWTEGPPSWDQSILCLTFPAYCCLAVFHF